MEYLYMMFLMETTTYESIVKLKPEINKAYAIELARSIDEHSKAYQIPSEAMVKLAYIESGFKLNAVNKRTLDYGVFQINIRNIKYYNLKKHDLLIDTDYSVRAGAMVFSYFYHRYGNLKEAVKRYNCGVKKSCVNHNSGYWRKYASI